MSTPTSVSVIRLRNPATDEFDKFGVAIECYGDPNLRVLLKLLCEQKTAFTVDDCDGYGSFTFRPILNN